jgi:broad specificity phosphatase PhoE
MATHRWVGGVRSVFASSERKARDGAQLLVEGLGLPGYSVVGSLGENDRSATGYLPKQEFEAAADAFFAGPQNSVRGWEPAADAQTRIVHAIEQAVSQASDTGDVAIVGHGGTGTLLYCHLAGLPISRRYEQPPTNGGNWFAFDWASRKLLHRGWRSIDTLTSDETGGVVIETVRLRIRSLHGNDLAHLVALVGNWEVARWVSSVPHPYTEVDGRNWIALVQQDHATGRPRRFAVALKETDRLIGGASTAVPATEVKNPRSPIGWDSLTGGTGMGVKRQRPSSITGSAPLALKRSAPTPIRAIRPRKKFSCTAA